MLATFVAIRFGAARPTVIEVLAEQRVAWRRSNFEVVRERIGFQ